MNGLRFVSLMEIDQFSSLDGLFPCNSFLLEKGYKKVGYIRIHILCTYYVGEIIQTIQREFGMSKRKEKTHRFNLIFIYRDIEIKKRFIIYRSFQITTYAYVNIIEFHYFFCFVPAFFLPSSYFNCCLRKSAFFK